MPSSDPKPERPELGEAWGNGTVVLAWDSVLAGAKDPADGQNVVLHEFAHEVAFEHDLIPTPILAEALGARPRGPSPTVVNPEEWQRVLAQSYEHLCTEMEMGDPTVLDRYAATDEAEFFAVATEGFFEKPAELRAAYPELYAQLVRLYRQDPAAVRQTA
jgi:Mlc titration factor MtfA (ptsG expression regulator)